MFNVNMMTPVRIWRLILPMLHLLTQVSSKRLPSSVFSHTAKSGPCSPEVINRRDVLGSPKNGRGRLDCVRRCMMDINCELAVYQEFLAGFATCTKMSAALPDSLNTLDVSDSKLCTALNVNPCLNQGILYQGVCVCQEGFTGQACEYTNPPFCHAKWIEIAKVVTAKRTLHLYSSLVESFSRATPKLVFRNNLLHVNSVMSAMDAGNNQASGYWYLLTYMFLEKASWNRFAEKPRRQFIQILTSGNYELLSLNATSRSYSQNNYQVDFSFVAPEEMRFTVQRQMPNDWELMADDLNDGYELDSSTWTNVNSEKGIVAAQLADRLLPMNMKGGHFGIPPEMRNVIYVLGVQTVRADSQMHAGSVSGISSGGAKRVSYLNPCWTTVDAGKYSKASLLTDWNMLGTELRLGKNVRIKIGTTYHQVLEVIQTGNGFTFLLAPFLAQNDTADSSSLYGVRSLVTSSSMYESCTHQIEGEVVIARDKYRISEKVVWFLDSRKWKKVFVVFSNSSVAEGSVSDLVSGVLAGSDVRIWIEWLKSGVSRFLETHMSSVTDDGKVSTESLVTWRPTNGSEVTLISKCDLQYILVTSEGWAEIMSFNVWTPAKSEVLNNVRIAWFLA